MYGAHLHDYAPTLSQDGVALTSLQVDALQPAAGRGNFDAASAARPIARVLATSADPLLWVAIPPAIDPNALGAALQQLVNDGVRVQGFVDSAVVLAASLRLSQHVLLLDASYQRTTISVVAIQAGTAQLRRTVVLDGGMAGILGSWVHLAAKAMVQQTRFDPLHSLQSETQLRARLPEMAAQAQREGRASCIFDGGAEPRELQLTRDQFASATSERLRPIGTTLQALSAALGDCQLLVTDVLAGLPGVSEMVRAAQLPEAYSLPPAAVACAAARLPPAPDSNAKAVQYFTQLTCAAVANAEFALAPLHHEDAAAAVSATHIVFRGRAVPITAVGLELGRNATGSAALQLPEGVAGVSRQHCTLRRDGSRAVVIDHSSFGTFVDGVRVRGRALLRAGSTLRVGDPGLEFPLVTLDVAGA